MNEREQEAALVEARSRLKALVLAIIGEGDIARFEEALTHPSFANESGAPDYQRLEFLGDAVLGLCVSEMLAQVHPDADEGALTRMRSALVNAEALAHWAQAIHLGEALALGRGARGGLERSRTNVLADAVEALVASVYIARGLDGARKLIEQIVGEPMQNVADLGTRDPKSLLQERVQAEGLSAPTYRVRAIHGPKHDPSFEIEVLVGADVAGVGEGRSKRVAERAAALAALSGRSEQAAAPPTIPEPPMSSEPTEPGENG
ncbi:MAG: ribonuclease III [Polyangiaceae bacterium]|nr:ribonuclease III [Polyangiaceae bacterium]